ncbi:uncharacterized protein LOC129003351 [Macrosteles quadrilineatus]|uniref:uncharacterized protein LOC129003351 n=1 Tax=Macrosteles quadrilineatus TaxID=74068 RepID=UPI0023E212BA|nr:uncharacterized protein LOC129003351 [Macrosteles quadrilineatus]
MYQLSEEFSDGKQIVYKLIEGIVGDAIDTISRQKERSVDIPMPQNACNIDRTKACLKTEGMNVEENMNDEKFDHPSIDSISYHNIAEDCVRTSTLATQGEGDFEHPYVREAKAFHQLQLESEGSDHKCPGSPSTSVHSSFTDELISQLHRDINGMSLDNIYLSDSEVEKECSAAREGLEIESFSKFEEESTQAKECHQINGSNDLENNRMDKENVFRLRCSPKFSHLNKIFPYDHINLKVNFDQNGKDEIQGFLSTCGQECFSTKSNDDGENSLTLTYPLENSIISSNEDSGTDSIFLKCEQGALNKEATVIITDDEETKENDWVEANEVEIRITEPASSKDSIQSESTANDMNIVNTRQYWSNIGLITEHSVDRRYLGPVDIPGLECMTGVTRVESKYLTNKQEELIRTTDAETLDVKTSDKNVQCLKDTGSNKSNYLSLPKTKEEQKKKKRLMSRLTKSISNIFKFHSKSFNE